MRVFVLLPVMSNVSFSISLEQTTPVLKLKVYAPPLTTCDYKGPEIPCLRIIKKWNSMKTAINQGSTKVCAL